MKLFPALSKTLFVAGFALLFVLAIPGIRGVIFSIISFLIGAFAIVFSMKYGNKQEHNHSPLLFDFLMIAALVAAFFSKEIPGRVYPVLICWLICFVSEVIFWLLDKQYEGKDIRQLISMNFRLPLIVDILIIVINVNNLITDGWNVNNVLFYLLVAFSLIDLCRQLMMAKSGKIDIKNIF